MTTALHPTGDLEQAHTTTGAAAAITRFASVLLAGLFAGFLLAALVLETSLRNFDASVYTQVRKVELAGLNDLATALLPPAIIATAIILVVAMRRRDRNRWLTLTAFVLLIAVFAISLLVNVPINTEQLTWSVQAPPANWASVRDHWQLAHLVRTVAAVLSFGLLIAGRPQAASNSAAAPAASTTQ